MVIHPLWGAIDWMGAGGNRNFVGRDFSHGGRVPPSKPVGRAAADPLSALVLFRRHTECSDLVA